MKTGTIFLYIALVISIFLVSKVSTAQVKVDQIMSSPEAYNQKMVAIEGIVTQYMPSESPGTFSYILTCNWGAPIQINTKSDKPRTNTKYLIKGIVNIEDSNIYIQEVRRQMIHGSIGGFWIILMFILIIISLVFGILSFIYYNRMMKGHIPYSQSQIQTPTNSFKTGSPQEYDRFFSSLEENAINVSSGYFSMKAFPASLLILSGPQSGMTLPLYGTFTNRGIVVTFGRDVPDWPKHVPAELQNSHIRIRDNSSRIARLQAKLFYNKGTMQLKNYGENPVTVDGSIPVREHQICKLKNGTIIKFGSLITQIIMSR